MCCFHQHEILLSLQICHQLVVLLFLQSKSIGRSTGAAAAGSCGQKRGRVGGGGGGVTVAKGQTRRASHLSPSDTAWRGNECGESMGPSQPIGAQMSAPAHCLSFQASAGPYWRAPVPDSRLLRAFWQNKDITLPIVSQTNVGTVSNSKVTLEKLLKDGTERISGLFRAHRYHRSELKAASTVKDAPLLCQIFGYHMPSDKTASTVKDAPSCARFSGTTCYLTKQLPLFKILSPVPPFVFWQNISNSSSISKKLVSMYKKLHIEKINFIFNFIPPLARNLLACSKSKKQTKQKQHL